MDGLRVGEAMETLREATVGPQRWGGRRVEAAGGGVFSGAG